MDCQDTGTLGKGRSVEQTGERSVRFDFTEPDSELPLIIGLRPILKKADWADVDFEASSLRVPVGLGALPVGGFEPGGSSVSSGTPTTGAGTCRSTGA